MKKNLVELDFQINDDIEKGPTQKWPLLDRRLGSVFFLFQEWRCVRSVRSGENDGNS